MGVAPSKHGASHNGASENGATVLRADGYSLVVPIEALPEHFDKQGHLNNAAIGVLFNDLRVTYISTTVAEWWYSHLREHKLVVAARESHILYESEGLPEEAYVGSMRYLRLEGKGALLEQRLVESSSGRAVARAWIVQLLVQNGSVIEWPDEYFDRIAAIEGIAIERRPKSARTWGP